MELTLTFWDDCEALAFAERMYQLLNVPVEISAALTFPYFVGIMECFFLGSRKCFDVFNITLSWVMSPADTYLVKTLVTCLSNLSYLLCSLDNSS